MQFHNAALEQLQKLVSQTYLRGKFKESYYEVNQVYVRILDRITLLGDSVKFISSSLLCKFTSPWLLSIIKPHTAVQ